MSKQNAVSDPLKPSLSILVKLGSIMVHVDEMLGPGGHDFDRIALQELIQDPELIDWSKAMGVYLPVKR